MGGMKDQAFGDRLCGELPRPPAETAFDGATYVPGRDHVRLAGQMLAVFELMKDGRWRTLAEIAETVKGTEAAVSARLRDFRKAKYGGREVRREHVGSGLFRYKLVIK